MIKLFNRSLYTALTIGILGGIHACSGEIEEKQEPAERPVSVTLCTVSVGLQPSISVSGTVEAAQTANISTRIMGRITSILVKTGDRVTRGQLLARVWDEDIKAKRAQTDAMIAEAEESFASAQKDYIRFNNLFKQQSATARELDNITLQYNAAKARVNAAKQIQNEVNANISYSSLIAPFSGVVTQKLAEEGSLANPGMPVLIIERDGILQVSASVAESEISHIHIGDVTSVQIKSTGQSFEGKIIEINPSSRFTGGQYIVKISIPEKDKKDIYAGMFTAVSIPIKNNPQVKNDMTLVPWSAIVNHDELTGIYTVSSLNTAWLRWVRLGKTYGDKVEVISGLSKDEKFIGSADSRLYNGVPVVVKSLNLNNGAPMVVKPFHDGSMATAERY